MDYWGVIVRGAETFVRNLYGIAVRPYETYRQMEKTGSYGDGIVVGLFLAAYFATASLVKTAAFRPYLLTKQFLVLAAAAGSMYLLTSSVLWIFGKRAGGRGDFVHFALLWVYTLIPTTMWFWVTSLLFVILPPPRTQSGAGVAFSVLYLVFSATLFYWKVILAYLALRFGMKLDLAKIALTVAVSSPVVGGYGYLMYKLGIFRVPFL